MNIEAIPTTYRDTEFRSALEANWAATLDQYGIRWNYEPQAVTLPSGATYIPDFHLPELGTWIEVKGTGIPRVEKAIEYGQHLACHCNGHCTCAWPGGQLVLIGHPAKPYSLLDDPAHESMTPEMLRNITRRHSGFLTWSAAQGRTTWFIPRCPDCGRAGWMRGECRACGSRCANTQAYRSGDTELRFIRAQESGTFLDLMRNNAVRAARKNAKEAS